MARLGRSRRLRVILIAVLGAAVIVAVNMVAYQSHAEADLSADGRFRLSADSRALIKSVHAPMQFTVFVNATGGTARDARFLLARFRDLNRQINYRVVDPDEDPATAKRMGITGYGTTVVEYEGRRADAPSAAEGDLATSMLRVLRGHTVTVCTLTGHGEAALDDDSADGLSSFARLLQQNAYEARPLDLATQSKVPDDCAAVVIAGLRTPLLPSEADALVAYERAAGRVLLLASPLSTADPNPLLQPWGISFAGGVVVDPARSADVDPTDLIVEDLPSANPVINEVPRLQLPVAGGLVLDPAPRDGLTLSRLGVSSSQSWDESQPDQALHFDGGDIPGPLVVAAAADDSHVDATGDTRVTGLDTPKIVRTRIVVTGSAEWLSNQLIDRLGNRRFAVNTMSWLTQEEQLVTATETVQSSRALPWTAERQAEVVAVTIGVVPGLVLALGAEQLLVGWRRRLRQPRPRRA
jgi:ABC-type uncharacterized transport system involved in gliding motility auxiliary subunit